MTNWWHVAAVLVGACLCAAVFWRLRLPMWPIAGGLVGAAVVQIALGGVTAMPAFLSPMGQVLIGAAVGSTVGPEIVREFIRFLGPGILAVAGMVTGGLGLGYVLYRLELFPFTEAMLSMVPGGVGEMVTGSVVLGADSGVVAGVHLIRLLTVMWTIPLFIALAKKLDNGNDEDTTS